MSFFLWMSDQIGCPYQVLGSSLYIYFLLVTMYEPTYVPYRKKSCIHFSCACFESRLKCERIIKKNSHFKISWRTYYAPFAVLGYICPLLNFSFSDFFMQSFEILTENRSSSSWSVFVGVMPLKYLLGPVGDMYCFSNTYGMLVLL